MSDIVNRVDSFANLCNPSKNKIKNLFNAFEVHPGNELRTKNRLKIDFFYVMTGYLKITFEKQLGLSGKVEQREIYLGPGEHTDFITQRFGLKDCDVKEIVCVNPSEAPSKAEEN
jgi:hypothetical protein